MTNAANSVHDFSVDDIQGKSTSLQAFKGNVLLIVNVASKCGLTPQYEGLEKVYEKYEAQGLKVLGFPANEFLAQEPGTNAEIAEFCTAKFGVKFPMFGKIVAKGDGQHPLYRYLTEKRPTAVKKTDSTLEAKLTEIGQPRKNPADILWNFEKFLVNKKGQVVERFSPDVAPDDALVTAAIERELKA